MPKRHAAEGEGVRPTRDERPETASAMPRPARPGEVEEIGGPRGPEPTRYGDWEKGGRCTDF